MTRLATIKSAVAGAIKAGCPRSAIDVAAWALTLGATETEIREEWAIALAKVPPNSGGDDLGEGK